MSAIIFFGNNEVWLSLPPTQLSRVRLSVVLCESFIQEAEFCRPDRHNLSTNGARTTAEMNSQMSLCCRSASPIYHVYPFCPPNFVDIGHKSTACNTLANCRCLYDPFGTENCQNSQLLGPIAGFKIECRSKVVCPACQVLDAVLLLILLDTCDRCLCTIHIYCIFVPEHTFSWHWRPGMAVIVFEIVTPNFKLVCTMCLAQRIQVCE